MDYQIKETNKFNNKILGQTVGAFETLELAKEYIDFKATLGDSYAVVCNGNIVYPND